MSGTSGVSGTTGGTSGTSGTSGRLTGSLGGASRDDFLRLLVTQMRYQDPMSPMDNRDFLAQLAQFAAVEQTAKMAADMSTYLEREKTKERERTLLSTASLLGRTVSGKTEDGIVFEGTVEEAVIKDGQWYLKVAGEERSLADVQRVAAGGTSP